jgi:hypothetical protein
LPYEEAPPTILLALTIATSAWLGWITSEKGGHPYSWQKIEEAYNYGERLSAEKRTP